MFDEKFVARFNAESPNRKYTLEEIIAMYNNMPNQRVGALFDLVRWAKNSPSNASKIILLSRRMAQLPRTTPDWWNGSRYFLG